jgi:hypothetical protein
MRERWEYSETKYAAQVNVRDSLTLKPHWSGTETDVELRRVCRLAATAPEMLQTLMDLESDLRHNVGNRITMANLAAGIIAKAKSKP